MARVERPPPEQFLTAARRAVELAARHDPPVTLFGIGTPAEPPTLTGTATAIAYLQHGPVVRLASAGRGECSYSLKHHAERWGRGFGLSPYVANGELIAAALALEIPITRPMRGNPNCNLAVRAVRRRAA